MYVSNYPFLSFRELNEYADPPRQFVFIAFGPINLFLQLKHKAKPVIWVRYISILRGTT
jgi:hypothetical protein